MEEEVRDSVTILDEEGNEKEYTIEALFDMEDQGYALIRNPDETLLMRIEDEDGEQYLVGITDDNEREAILDAYQIAVEAAPAE